MADSKNIDDVGYAFPVNDLVRRDADGKLFGAPISSPGMSLRDYFAGQMLPRIGTGWPNYENRETLAKQAYEMADAMIAARGGRS